jgi:hypothetical protein
VAIILSVGVGRQGVLVPRVGGGADAAGAVPAGRADGPGHPAARAPGVGAGARRGGVRRDRVLAHQVRLHGRQGLRQGLGHQPAQQGARQPARLLGEWVTVGDSSFTNVTDFFYFLFYFYTSFASSRTVLIEGVRTI